MAGRGTDIRLAKGVTALGGLYVMGTNRHESRRVDNQLRGRAGRQGDPGVSRFFVSLEDDLLVKYGIDNLRLGHDPESIQRLVEGQNLDIRKFLSKYESVVEAQRRAVQQRRQSLLSGTTHCSSELERLVSLTTIDELWAEHLSMVGELRDGIQLVSWDRDPLREYLLRVADLYRELQERIAEEIPKRLAEAETNSIDPSQRGATWTYLTTDQPFGSLEGRLARTLVRKVKARSLWG
jgi:preprotein translocase subunit SecA